MKVFKTKVVAEFNPDAIDIAEAFWGMDEEEQCYFFEHLYKIAGHKLPMQLQYVIDSSYFSVEARMAMQCIGEYGRECHE